MWSSFFLQLPVVPDRLSFFASLKKDLPVQMGRPDSTFSPDTLCILTAARDALWAMVGGGCLNRGQKKGPRESFG